jgi:hypothetical protein
VRGAEQRRQAGGQPAAGSHGCNDFCSGGRKGDRDRATTGRQISSTGRRRCVPPSWRPRLRLVAVPAWGSRPYDGDGRFDTVSGSRRLWPASHLPAWCTPRTGCVCLVVHRSVFDRDGLAGSRSPPWNANSPCNGTQAFFTSELSEYIRWGVLCNMHRHGHGQMACLSDALV